METYWTYSRIKAIAVAVVALVGAIVLAYAGSEKILTYLIPAYIWAIVAMGWTAIFRTGQFSLGQGAFMMIGAYSSAILTTSVAETTQITSAIFQLPVLVGMLIAAVISGVLAFIIGAITLRLGGIFFCIVTLAFNEVIRIVAVGLPHWFGGVNGILAPFPGPFGIDFQHSKRPFYLLTLMILVLAAIVFWRLDKSRIGSRFRAVAANKNLAEHTGLHLAKYRIIAFTVAGTFAGLAGALFGHYLHVVTPTLFGMAEAIMVLIMCTAGGTRSPVVGATVGALVLSPLGDYLTSKLQGGKLMVFGIIVLLVAFFLVNGISSAPDSIKDLIVGRMKKVRA